MQLKWSFTWYDPLGPWMCVLELMNGHALQTLREQLNVPGSRLEGSELLTSEFLRFWSRLNETSGGLGKIGAVSGSECEILKFLRTRFLAAKLLGWKVSVKGIRSSLSGADGSKADYLLTFLDTIECFRQDAVGIATFGKEIRHFIAFGVKVRPKGLYQVNDHFDCTTSNIIYCITCTLCNKLYMGESGHTIGDHFREHLLDVKNKGSDLSKPVARHFISFGPFARTHGNLLWFEWSSGFVV